MPEQIAVDPGTLRQHAVGVTQVASEVRRAASAADGLDLGGGAFGVMCAFMVLPATVVSAAGVAVISAAGAMIERAADEVRGWAGDAERGEELTVEEIQTLRTGVCTP